MATPGKPDVSDNLVRVFDSDQESEVMVVRGLLEDAGIDCTTMNLDAPQDILPGVGGVVLLVRAEDADVARQFIEEGRVAGPDAADRGELEGESTGVPETDL
jgi:Putative prokaryotic signal transducing protein